MNKNVSKIIVYIIVAGLSLIVVKYLLKNVSYLVRKAQINKDLKQKGIDPKERKFNDKQIKDWAKKLKDTLYTSPINIDYLRHYTAGVSYYTVSGFLTLQNMYEKITGKSLNDDLKSKVDAKILAEIRGYWSKFPKEYLP